MLSNAYKLLSVLLAPIMVHSSALAHDVEKGPLRIDHPWARPTLSVAAPGAAYLVIENHGTEADRLVRAEVPPAIARASEIHRTTEEKGVSRMQHLVDGVAIPPGGRVAFEPGGLHLMLLGLETRLEAGARFSGTLVFEKAGEIEVEFWVEEGDGAAANDHAHR